MDNTHELNCVITNQQVEIEVLKLENKMLKGAIKNLTGMDCNNIIELKLIEILKPTKVNINTTEYKITEEEALKNRENNIIPDAETQYLAFIQDKQQEILTLRVRTNNG